ncbi:DUF86 domain-containing protein [Caldivirga maquilingensis]|uniref:DUF86 domain-containing protein n=1 Tax=Caldivirga maquilingensis (strain ATCC 700844 / DSM 13496 / JCM 10307 / IC-167) TaxID=397948 RepID=A8M943_CALMQ|nr:HepT-like ribonuclease domain-containing protein [Caldivirga maquilingensis]ABW02262.1 protein of unknown function DUF86 [Caldivirga maquilingensis IC-167]
MNLKGIDENYVTSLMRDIEGVINEIVNISSKPFNELSTAEKYAIRYGIIVIAEALTALGIEPEPPIHALRVLRDNGLLTLNECDELERLIRLRNLLVHRYWTVDDRRIYENIKGDFKHILNLIDRLKRVQNHDNSI